MPSCPFCQTELPDDFGLIDCSGCDASLFIEMDGSVRSNESEPEEPASEEPAAVVEPAGEDYNFELSEDSQESPPEPPPELDPGEEEFPSEPVSFDEPVASEEESMEETMDEPMEENAEFAEPDSPLEVPPPVTDSFESEDISNLATAIDQRGTLDGLRYNLEISGIDTSDLRREVFEALLDKKLGWDTEEVVNSIEAGVLELKSVTAVKAQVVVQRLKVLPLKIRWEQYADS